MSCKATTQQKFWMITTRFTAMIMTNRDRTECEVVLSITEKRVRISSFLSALRDMAIEKILSEITPAASIEAC